MSQVFTIFKNEAISNRGWFVGWLLGIGVTFLIIIGMYPGEEGMASFLDLLEDDNFAAFFGDLSGSDPGYSLWVGLMFPFITIIIFIFSINSGVKIVTLESDNGTGEIIFVVPISRRSFFFAKWISMVVYLLGIIGTIIIVLAIPFGGHSLEFDVLTTLFLHTALFTLSGVSIGIVLGLVTGRGDKGSQVSLLSVLAFYTIQSLGRINDQIDKLNDINVLELFDPVSILLFNRSDDEKLFAMTLIFVLGLLFGLFGYENKDLIENRGLSFGAHKTKVQPVINFFKVILSPLIFVYKWLSAQINSIMVWIVTRKNPENNNTSFHIDRSSRTSVFTFWVRPLENRFPITADFVYSERRVLLVMFWAIVTVYPLQLALYPGDEPTQDLILGFGGGGVFELFTYGHNIDNNPYLWYVITQAIGGHWIFFLALVFHWIKKVTMDDAESGTGEILGSQPVPYRSIIFQRCLAILLEIVWIAANMIVWLIISEEITGSSAGLMWEIIAILMIIPFYVFWTALLISIALYFRSSGVKIARAAYFASFLAFAVGIINKDYDYWYVKNIFGLYDPVVIIQDRSIFSNNGGMLIILLLSIISPLILAYTSKYYTWSRFDKQRDESTYTLNVTDTL